MAWEKSDLVQRGHHFAIVDEGGVGQNDAQVEASVGEFLEPLRPVEGGNQQQNKDSKTLVLLASTIQFSSHHAPPRHRAGITKNKQKSTSFLKEREEADKAAK